MNQICLLGGLPDVTDFLVSVIREICDSDKHADTAPAVSIFQSPKSEIIRDSKRATINHTTTSRGTPKIREIREIRDSDKHADTPPTVSIFQAAKAAIIRDSDLSAKLRLTNRRIHGMI